MASPKVFINDGYTKKDGTSAVYILVHLRGESIKFSTGISCDPEKFNYKTSRLIGNSKKVKDDNLSIERGLAIINEIFVRYRLQFEALTPDILKKEWKNPTRRVNFYAWMDETIKMRKGDLADSSLKQHKSLQSKMMEFKAKLSFAEINYEFIDQFRRWLKVEKNSGPNTVQNNLKNLKAYLNIAKNQGVISENPFDRIKLRRSTPERIFLIEEEINKLWKEYNNQTLPGTYHRVLRHFLFMCLTGLRISDLIKVSFDNIVNGRLVFFPAKTRGIKKISVKIPLNKFTVQLIREEGRSSGKLFDCISEQQMNKKIKDIAGFAGIPKKLSNHSGRHTFATLYLQKTQDVAGLQKMLGHSNIGQTMVYVHINDDMLKEQMQKFEGSLFK
ncbi:MAG: site-specific integrase [Mariniphaga sp.]|nr:site-specific integrase [Mariniphaga sp.]